MPSASPKRYGARDERDIRVTVSASAPHALTTQAQQDPEASSSTYQLHVMGLTHPTFVTYHQ
jgi:hypothetical protein